MGLKREIERGGRAFEDDSRAETHGSVSTLEQAKRCSRELWVIGYWKTRVNVQLVCKTAKRPNLKQGSPIWCFMINKCFSTDTVALSGSHLALAGPFACCACLAAFFWLSGGLALRSAVDVSCRASGEL